MALVRFEFYGGCSSVGTGRDLSAYGLYLQNYKVNYNGSIILPLLFLGEGWGEVKFLFQKEQGGFNS